MLHISETWPLTKTNLQCLQGNDRVMIRQIWGNKSELLAKFKLGDLDFILRERRLGWFGHVESFSGAARTACGIQVEGKWGPGRPKLTWKKMRENDCQG